MKLEKAIEIKQLALDTGVVDDPDDFRAADRLSIEALKRVEEQSGNPKFGRHKPLPGETEE